MDNNYVNKSELDINEKLIVDVKFKPMSTLIFGGVLGGVCCATLNPLAIVLGGVILLYSIFVYMNVKDYITLSIYETFVLVYAYQSEDLVQTLNYINALVVVNDNDKMVYITNKSKLDEKFGITKEIEEKYGFSTEQYFKDAISEYIKPENVHFISGHANSIAEDLERLAGGIHCKICEIPE